MLVRLRENSQICYNGQSAGNQSKKKFFLQVGSSETTRENTKTFFVYDIVHTYMKVYVVYENSKTSV